MSSVEMRNVSRVYQSGACEIKAVAALDLLVESGEFTVLAGPSGSGKSTLLNLAGGLDRPTSGEVFLNGESLNNQSDDQLTRQRLFKIGFIFQAYNLIPVLSAYENIQFTLQLQGIPESEHAGRIRPLLAELGLEGLEYRRPAELSGGQQQRVAVARAMIGQPAIILADEPTANLDSESAISLLQLMKQLNDEKGVTFLFSSHDQRVIDIARRVIRLRDGKINEDTGKSC
ncbi:MAG: ABC transporter ATP-binding protein [Candidatus Riflebacteria bacterium]|nr:ABC transporter ATP-binding protein [Candidatus Riflebacteria bacterium]